MIKTMAKIMINLTDCLKGRRSDFLRVWWFCGCLIVGQNAHAQTVQTAPTPTAPEKILTIASWLPPDSGMNRLFLAQFIHEIERLTGGRVSGKIEYNLAAVPALVDLIEDGGADISWVLHGYTPGRFVSSQLPELPGLGGTSESVSVAYWRTYEKFFKSADEYKNLELLGLLVHEPAYLLMADKIGGLGDIVGKKLRLPGGVGSAVAKALGAVPILVAAPKIHETIGNKVADGVFIPPDLFDTLKLSEVAPHAYSLPGGFYRASFAIIMNPSSLTGVSETDQRALRTFFGEPLSALAGRAWDQTGEEGLAAYLKTAQVSELSSADQALLAQKSQPIVKAVVAELNAAGIDGQAALSFLQNTIKDYQASHPPTANSLIYAAPKTEIAETAMPKKTSPETATK